MKGEINEREDKKKKEKQLTSNDCEPPHT